MADVKDLVKADPIETLEKASKISLQGGGALLFVAVAAVYAVNVAKWQVDNWLIALALIGAVLIGLAGTLARMYDAHLRVKLSLKLLEVKGTTDAEKAEVLPAIKDILKDPVVIYAIQASGSGGGN